MNIEFVLPQDIERRSFEIIASELPHELDPALAPIIMRVIHTTADFEYADSLYFSEGAVQASLDALKTGATIVTDTTMALSGVNKPALALLGGRAHCYIGDSDVAEAAKLNGTTRAVAAVDKAAELGSNLILAIGNAPTALLRICELMDTGALTPALVIGAPVGFVNVVQSKEALMQRSAPCVVTRGRKGGSNVAAAIVNALMYILTRG